MELAIPFTFTLFASLDIDDRLAAKINPNAIVADAQAAMGEVLHAQPEILDALVQGIMDFTKWDISAALLRTENFQKKNV